MPDAATQEGCTLCGRPVCRSCRAYVNARRVCRACAAQVQSELDREIASTASVPGAIVGGAIGALAGGAAWALIAIVTNLEVGYVAVGVGFLAGFGAFLGAGKKKGKQVQIVAVACALLGLLVGKYATVVTFVNREYGVDVSYFDGRMIQVFLENLKDVMQPMDVLWIVLAFLAAVRVTRPTAARVRVSGAR
jgi:hypothetical protein